MELSGVLFVKYYIEYPIKIRCSLKCAYCFHGEAFELEKQGRRGDKYTDVCPFTPEQYKAWRDKHLSDGTEFLCELHGGEISHPANTELALHIIDTLDKERFQIQTNGLGNPSFYATLIKRKAKIDRIGFTFHRDGIGNNPAAVKKFIHNVKFVHTAGLKVYVKELLILKHRAAILDNKKFWERMGIEFRVQDFKGYRGRAAQKEYSQEDYELIHPEYCHEEPECACRKGYRQILIRGYDIFAGDVVACWIDPVVVGNVLRGWYNPRYKINRGNGVEVNGVEKLYRGSYPRDTWNPDVEKCYLNLTKQQIKQRSVVMLEAMKRDVANYEKAIDVNNNTIAQKTQAVNNLNAEIAELRNMNIGFDGARQQAERTINLLKQQDEAQTKAPTPAEAVPKAAAPEAAVEKAPPQKTPVIAARNNKKKKRNKKRK